MLWQHNRGACQLFRQTVLADDYVPVGLGRWLSGHDPREEAEELAQPPRPSPPIRTSSRSGKTPTRHPHPEGSQGGVRQAAMRGLKLPGWRYFSVVVMTLDYFRCLLTALVI